MPCGGKPTVPDQDNPEAPVFVIVDGKAVPFDVTPMPDVDDDPQDNPEGQASRSFLVTDNTQGWSGQAWDWESVDAHVQSITAYAEQEGEELSITITVEVDQRLREDLKIADRIRALTDDGYIAYLLEDDA